MRHSYINPRKKTILTQEFQLTFLFFGITLFMLLSTYIFLLFKDYRFHEEIRSVTQNRVELNNQIGEMKKEIAYIEKQSALSEKIKTKNSVLKDSITNLFDLIPDRITLSQAKLLHNGLILYGITPNKDIYNFMLQAPLRSIFNNTYSSFYPQKNGWLKFVSTNYMKTDGINMKEGNNNNAD